MTFDASAEDIVDCFNPGSYFNAIVQRTAPLAGFTYGYDITFAGSDLNSPNSCSHSHLYNFLYQVNNPYDEY